MNREVAGGWPHCLRIFLRHFLMGLPGLATSGVALALDGGDVMLHARFAASLADGDGHAKALDWKGASGLKPCFRHYNVYKKAIPWSSYAHIQRAARPLLNHVQMERPCRCK